MATVDKLRRSKAYVTLNGVNLLATHMMNLVSYEIGSPVPLVKIITVPGRPGNLDATLALNGKVNYVSRPITARFHIRNNPYDAWHTKLSTLLKLFDGVESKMVFSTDPDWYYKGRFTFELEKTSEVSSFITLTCDDAFPYKLEDITVSDTISGSKYVYCTGKDYNGTVTIYSSSSSMSVRFGSQTYQLRSGNNVIREIHLSSGSNSLYFTGTGSVRITYERGVL